jgi:hypothetical protein
MRVTTNVRQAADRLAAHLGVELEGAPGSRTLTLTFPNGRRYMGNAVACVGTLWRWAVSAAPAGQGAEPAGLRAAVRLHLSDFAVAKLQGATHDKAALKALRLPDEEA